MGYSVSSELKVAHLGTSSQVSHESGPWGVRTVDDVPSGAFVCIVAGQVRVC